MKGEKRRAAQRTITTLSPSENSTASSLGSTSGCSHASNLPASFAGESGRPGEHQGSSRLPRQQINPFLIRGHTNPGSGNREGKLETAGGGEKQQTNKQKHDYRTAPNESRSNKTNWAEPRQACAYDFQHPACFCGRTCRPQFSRRPALLTNAPESHSF